MLAMKEFKVKNTDRGFSTRRNRDMENTEASMKSVDVKLLDMDWFFQDGNGRRLIWMLAMTNHEELFQTR